eukprot:Gb_28518 [translate_table: standard]
MPHKCIEVKSSLKEVNKEQIAKGKYAGNDETGSGMTTGYKGAESQEQQTLKTEGQNDDTEEREDGNRRGLSETTYALEDGKQTYHKFTSCIPAAEEEKLSVLGFEVFILDHESTNFRSKYRGSELDDWRALADLPPEQNCVISSISLEG